MAPAFIQGKVVGAGAVNGQSVAYGSNITAGSLLLVLSVINGVTGGSPSVSAMGVSDTLINTWNPVWAAIQHPATGNSLQSFIQGWWAISPSGGANTVTNSSTSTGTLQQNKLSIAEFSGFTSALTIRDLRPTPVTANGNVSGNGPLLGQSYTTTALNEVIFTWSENSIGFTTATIASPFVKIGLDAVNSALAYCLAPTIGTYAFASSATNAAAGGTGRVTAGFSISAGSTGLPNSLMLMGVGT